MAATAAKFMWQQTTLNNFYSVSIEPREKKIPIGEYHEWKIGLLDSRDNPVTEARISMNGGMPKHGHGLPSKPKITEHLGGGFYRIEGVRFNMGGPWVLEFRIDSASGQDAVQFDIELAF